MKCASSGGNVVLRPRMRFVRLELRTFGPSTRLASWKRENRVVPNPLVHKVVHVDNQGSGDADDGVSRTCWSRKVRIFCVKRNSTSFLEVMGILVVVLTAVVIFYRVK